MHVFGHSRRGVQNISLGVQAGGEVGLVELPFSTTKSQKGTDALPLGSLIALSSSLTKLIGHVIEEGHSVQLKPFGQDVFTGLEEVNKFRLLLFAG